MKLTIDIKELIPIAIALKKDRDAILDALKRVDIDCEYCKHRITNAEYCDECDFDCDKCKNKANCRCGGCGRDNEHWEWCDIKEEGAR